MITHAPDDTVRILSRPPPERSAEELAKEAEDNARWEAKRAEEKRLREEWVAKEKVRKEAREQEEKERVARQQREAREQRQQKRAAAASPWQPRKKTKQTSSALTPAPTAPEDMADSGEDEEDSEERAARQRLERLERLTADATIAEWSEAQVSEWISLIDLPDVCAEAVQELFSDMDGEELLELTPKTLRRMLRLVGVSEPGPAAEAILWKRGPNLGL